MITRSTTIISDFDCDDYDDDDDDSSMIYIIRAMMTFIDDDIGLTALEAPSRWNCQALVSSMSEPDDIVVLSKSYQQHCYWHFCLNIISSVYFLLLYICHLRIF